MAIFNSYVCLPEGSAPSANPCNTTSTDIWRPDAVQLPVFAEGGPLGALGAAEHDAPKDEVGQDLQLWPSISYNWLVHWVKKNFYT